MKNLQTENKKWNTPCTLRQESEETYFHSTFYNYSLNFSKRKKVLLRERKRDTDRSVSSTPYAVLSGGA